MMAATKVQRCARCNRRLRNPRGSGADWAVLVVTDQKTSLSRADEFICPGCTTAEENVQRELNDASSDYVWVTPEQFQIWPKSASN